MTLEALIYTPTTDRELFTARLLSAWLTAVSVALAGFLVYAVNANAAGWSAMQRVFFPNAMWLVLVFWVVPAVPGLGLCVMTLISARAQGFQDANQLGGVVVMPVLLLLFGQISGLMWFNIGVAMLLRLVIWLLDGLLIWLGSRSFRRSRLLAA